MQKHVNLVDLVKSFPTNVYLQNLASIQPRTSLSKFGENEYIIQSTPYLANALPIRTAVEVMDGFRLLAG